MSTMDAIRISDLPSASCREESPAEAATMTAREESVKKVAQDRLKAGPRSDDDAQREVEGAAGADERASQLQVRARLDEGPALLFVEAEEPELVVTPTGHPLVLGGKLVGWRKLGSGHTSSNEHIPAEFVGRT